jgi:hypothetical protein
MANTLTNLIPTIRVSIDKISRELTGFIPAVSFFPGSEGVALNQTIRWPVAPTSSAADITPAATGPSIANQTIGSDTMTISKSRSVSFSWNGEEQLSVNGQYNEMLAGQFTQAMRALVNEVETDLAALADNASRAYGTAGTTPFASDLGDPAQIRKILADNGAPMSDMQLVIDTTAGANLRTLAQLTKANEAGSEELLRRGVLLDIHGLAIRESAQVNSHTKGTGASYLVNNASGYSVGDTTIAADTGTGTILAGDVVTFAGDSNKYLVTTALSGGSFTIAEPGLRAALADNTAITVGASYTGNMAFDRSAIQLATRVPAMPSGGDSAADVTTVTDPQSGLSFQVAMYPQYRQVTYEVGLAWGVKNAKPAHSAVLLG